MKKKYKFLILDCTVDPSRDRKKFALLLKQQYGIKVILSPIKRFKKHVRAISTGGYSREIPALCEKHHPDVVIVPGILRNGSFAWKCDDIASSLKGLNIVVLSLWGVGCDDRSIELTNWRQACGIDIVAVRKGMLKNDDYRNRVIQRIFHELEKRSPGNINDDTSTIMYHPINE